MERTLADPRSCCCNVPKTFGIRLQNVAKVKNAADVWTSFGSLGTESVDIRHLPPLGFKQCSARWGCQAPPWGFWIFQGRWCCQVSGWSKEGTYAGGTYPTEFWNTPPSSRCTRTFTSCLEAPQSDSERSEVSLASSRTTLLILGGIREL